MAHAKPVQLSVREVASIQGLEESDTTIKAPSESQRLSVTVTTLFPIKYPASEFDE